MSADAFMKVTGPPLLAWAVVFPLPLFWPLPFLAFFLLLLVPARPPSPSCSINAYASLRNEEMTQVFEAHTKFCYWL